MAVAKPIMPVITATILKDLQKLCGYYTAIVVNVSWALSKWFLSLVVGI